ncbi:hypothetical protein FRB97_000248 [Tulasnella sp. 331]|nr:hypothetical protein FRB97_000248 [Tulasnella sp. 331]
MVRNHDPIAAQEILNTFFAHGHCELDVSRRYAGGQAEPFLASLDLKGKAIVDTKISPAGNPGAHKQENLRKIFQQSMDHFGPQGIKIRTLYLHAPDRTVPYEDTVSELDKMHKEGLLYVI